MIVSGPESIRLSQAQTHPTMRRNRSGASSRGRWYSARDRSLHSGCCDRGSFWVVPIWVQESPARFDRFAYHGVTGLAQLAPFRRAVAPEVLLGLEQAHHIGTAGHERKAQLRKIVLPAAGRWDTPSEIRAPDRKPDGHSRDRETWAGRITLSERCVTMR